MRPGKRPENARIKTQASIDVDLGFIAHIQIGASEAIATSDTAVLAAVTLDATEEQLITEGVINPAIPRALRIKGNAAGIVGNVVITGTNYAGEAITETIALNGSTAVNGAKAFSTVANVLFPARNAAGNTVSVGFNDVLGLPYKLAHNTVLKAYLDNVLEATAPTVTTSATAIESNTVDLHSALDGSAVDIYLIA